MQKRAGDRAGYLAGESDGVAMTEVLLHIAIEARKLDMR
jgi:hypothetical protein